MLASFISICFILVLLIVSGIILNVYAYEIEEQDWHKTEITRLLGVLLSIISGVCLVVFLTTTAIDDNWGFYKNHEFYTDNFQKYVSTNNDAMYLTYMGIVYINTNKLDIENFDCITNLHIYSTENIYGVEIKKTVLLNY